MKLLCSGKYKKTGGINMSTKAYYPISEIGKGKTGFTSSTRAT